MKNKRQRNSYTDDFKKEAVALAEQAGYTVASAARTLGINANLLRRWRNELSGDSQTGQISEDERAELQRLRKENRELKMEKEILKKATAFFAKETK